MVDSAMERTAYQRRLEGKPPYRNAGKVVRIRWKRSFVVAGSAGRLT